MKKPFLCILLFILLLSGCFALNKDKKYIFLHSADEIIKISVVYVYNFDEESNLYEIEEHLCDSYDCNDFLDDFYKLEFKKSFGAPNYLYEGYALLIYYSNGDCEYIGNNRQTTIEGMKNGYGRYVHCDKDLFYDFLKRFIDKNAEAEQ